MDSKTKIHRLLGECCDELLAYIKEREPLHNGGWVPAAELKEDLDLKFIATPKSATQYGKTGWLFATFARMLEDDGRLECKLERKRAFCRSTQRRVEE